MVWVFLTQLLSIGISIHPAKRKAKLMSVIIRWWDYSKHDFPSSLYTHKTIIAFRYITNSLYYISLVWCMSRYQFLPLQSKEKKSYCMCVYVAVISDYIMQIRIRALETRVWLITNFNLVVRVWNTLKRNLRKIQVSLDHWKWSWL